MNSSLPRIWKITKRVLKYISMILLIIVVIVVMWQLTLHPSNDRDWSADQKILPSATINGNLVSIHNIRNFTYASTTSYTPAYYDATYDVSKLKKIYYFVEPFTGIGAAHTFLSFEFENNSFVSISIEIRKEKGESFSPLRGFLRQYEAMYVVADEKDVVKLRTNYRKDQVYMYPMKASKEGAQKVFLSVINKINSLQTKPEFYNTVFNNCMTGIASHVNTVSPGHVPWNYTYIFPENSDRFALNLGLIDTDETDIEKVRATHNINALAQKYADDSDFSLRIRNR